jgi:transcriptional regulator GlxA family with amidase domain
VIGPYEIFASAEAIPQSPGHPIILGYSVEVIGVTDNPVVKGEFGLSFIADCTYRDLRGDIDTLLIAGGFGVWEAAKDQELLNWLRHVSQKIRRICSICTGAFVLAAAGLLDGRRATSHWYWCELLAKTYPKVNVDPNPIFLRDGNIYTSAGITAGMDLALALVEEDYGAERSLLLARAFVLFLRRSGGQSQFSSVLSTQAATRDSFSQLQGWMLEHIDEPMTVETLAAQINLSPRQFARVFVAEFAMTPARFVEKLRIEAAQRLLRETDYAPKQVASRCGFASDEVMRRAFIRNIGISAIAYRKRFS